MRTVDDFKEWHQQWLSQPGARVCHHDNAIIRVRDDRSMVGCMVCGFVVPVTAGTMEPIILPGPVS